MRILEELPENARKYLERISELCNVQFLSSVGPDEANRPLLKELWVELYISHTQ